MTPASTALALTDDLGAIKRYLAEGKLALVAELVMSAEERITVVTEYLREVREAAGMPVAAPILTLVAA